MESESLDRLATALLAEPGVVSVYVFGSVARGRPRPLSDVDVAVLLAAGEPPAERLRRRLQLLVIASRALGRDDVDLVILNDASPALSYEVLRKGRRIGCGDRGADVAYRVRAMREYCDTAPLRRQHSQALKRRIEEGRFGRLAPGRGFSLAQVRRLSRQVAGAGGDAERRVPPR